MERGLLLQVQQNMDTVTISEVGEGEGGWKGDCYYKFSKTWTLSPSPKWMMGVVTNDVTCPSINPN